MTPSPELQRPGFGAAVRFWLLLGCISFGGPAGQIAVMHVELVDKRRWVDEATFLRALDFCMLLPGPEAMQLATWLGWRLHGLRGGLVAGALFILPAALLLAVFAWLYMRFGHVPVAAGVLFGLQAAVLGIIVHALYRIGGRVLRTQFALALALAALLLMALARVPFPLIVLGAAVAGATLYGWRPAWLAPPRSRGDATAAASFQPVPIGRVLRVVMALVLAWWLPLLAVAAWLGTESTAFAMAVFFSKAALVTFGGAYAVLPYVAGQAVEVHGWLDASQMMAGLGLAETTPGPLILVLEFVGFVGGWQQPDLSTPLTSALLCAAITVWATFLPSFLFVLACAPWIERLGAMPRVSAALAAVTAAVVGVIAQLALWFGRELLSDASPARAALAIFIALAVYLGLAKWRVSVAVLVPAAAAFGAAGTHLLG